MKETKNDLKIDLKVCEACGTIWFRSRSNPTVYCSRCVKVLAEMPASRRKPVCRPSRTQGTAARFSPFAVAGGTR